MRELSPKLNKRGKVGFSMTQVHNDIRDQIAVNKTRSTRKSLAHLRELRERHIRKQGIVPNGRVRHIDSGQEYVVYGIDAKGSVVVIDQTGKAIKYVPEVFVRVLEKSEKEVV